MSLAVAVATPVALTAIAKLRAAQPPALGAQQPTLAPADALREGIRQYRAGQFEEAVATLRAVDDNALGDADKRTLYDTLGRADKAAADRKTARAEFELGQEALRNNRPGEASAHYYNVINNRSVDEGTRRKAQEQLAVADAARKGMSGDARTTYNAAVADYKAGNLGLARQKFEQLRAQGYRPAMFQKAPDDYLREIARKMPAPEQGPNRTELAMPGDQALTPPAAAPVAQVPPAPAPTVPAGAIPPGPELTGLPPAPAPVDPGVGAIPPAPAPTEPSVAAIPPAPAPMDPSSAVPPPPAP
ncbi:MAG TPA: hypothetical protein VER17_00515, partial [Tepidisphaeraceae bacterium]|nr:hypothetical protein [Tepidisphaeraceae bacterium]